MSTFYLKDLREKFTDCEFIGKENQPISRVVGLMDSLGKKCDDCLSWTNDKNSLLVKAEQLHLGLLILSRPAYQHLSKASCNFLIAENPRATFARVTSHYFKSEYLPGIEKTAVIHESATIGKNCYVGHHVVIGEKCTIGDNTTILHNTVILANTEIGNHVVIGCNNTIGNYGFGYEKDEQGEYQALEHLGKVVIRDHVEIHNNTCIDRGVLGVTEIGENVKIDNLVHVAHGVTIGRNSLVIANAMIGGSAKIGADVWIAPSVSLKNQIQIASKTMTGIGAVILKDTQENSVMIGNPATTMEEYKKWSETKKKLQ
jgi:UDP-3-O-[3-hydroxymyristoyl] glucosamine N-acyltransferase